MNPLQWPDRHGWMYQGGGPHELVADGTKSKPYRRRCRHCHAQWDRRNDWPSADEVCGRRRPITGRAADRGYEVLWIQREDGTARLEWTVDGIELEFEIGEDNLSWRRVVPDWAIGVVLGVRAVLRNIEPAHIAAIQQRERRLTMLLPDVVSPSVAPPSPPKPLPADPPLPDNVRPFPGTRGDRSP